MHVTFAFLRLKVSEVVGIIVPLSKGKLNFTEVEVLTQFLLAEEATLDLVSRFGWCQSSCFYRHLWLFW